MGTGSAPLSPTASEVATQRGQGVWACLQVLGQQSCCGRNYAWQTQYKPREIMWNLWGKWSIFQIQNMYSFHSISASSPFTPSSPARADLKHLSKSLSACGRRWGSVWPQPLPKTQACAAEREKAAYVLRMEKEST